MSEIFVEECESSLSGLSVLSVLSSGSECPNHFSQRFSNFPILGILGEMRHQVEFKTRFFLIGRRAHDGNGSVVSKAVLVSHVSHDGREEKNRKFHFLSFIFSCVVHKQMG